MHASTTPLSHDPDTVGTGNPDTGNERDMVVDAVANLLDVWGDLAPAEALTRALVAERTENRAMALRWTHVYLACINRK